MYEYDFELNFFSFMARLGGIIRVGKEILWITLFVFDLLRKVWNVISSNRISG